MRYRRNNLFLPLVILSATRHIHDPITRFIGMARNASNDILNVAPMGISTPVSDATRDLGSFSAMTTIGSFDFEPTQVASHLDFSEDTDNNGRLIPETICNAPGASAMIVLPTAEVVNSCTLKSIYASPSELGAVVLPESQKLEDAAKKTEGALDDEVSHPIRQTEQGDPAVHATADALEVPKSWRPIMGQSFDVEALFEIASLMVSLPKLPSATCLNFSDSSKVNQLIDR